MEQKVRGLAVTGGVLALVVGLAACGTSPAGEAASGGGPISTSACPPGADKPVTGDTITIGTTGPLSGPYASVGALPKANQAYVDLVNSRGGVQTVDGKKKLKLITLDDQYVPSKVQTNVHELVEKDNVTAVVGLVGTANAAAVAPYLNQQCVPEMFALAGAASILSPKHPFTSLTSTYLDQGAVLGQYLKKHHPNATVAVLYQNDDTGGDTLKGMERVLSGSGVKIVDRQSYEVTDTDVKSQMTTLAATKADVFVDLSLSVKCTQSLAALEAGSWRPTVVTASMCSAGVIAAAGAPEATKDLYRTNNTKSSAVKFGDDPAYQLFHTTVSAKGIKPGDAELAWLNFQFVLAAIENARKLSSVGLAESAAALPADTHIPFLEDGIKIVSKPATAAIKGYTMDRWDGAHGQFVPTGEAPYDVSSG